MRESEIYTYIYREREKEREREREKRRAKQERLDLINRHKTLKECFTVFFCYFLHSF